MQYIEGSVSVTNGSTTVTGTGTAFQANVSAGQLFTIKDSGVFYTIGAVVDDDELTLASPYAGSNASGQDYIVHIDFTPNFGFPEIHNGDLNWPDILTQALRAIDILLGARLTAAGAITPAAIADSAAANGSLFIGTDHSSKLCFKDGEGSVHVLY